MTNMQDMFSGAAYLRIKSVAYINPKRMGGSCDALVPVSHLDTPAYMGHWIQASASADPACWTFD